jgi:8-oxo-dGTP pyrophosphatase MutT (NUDIX family)
VVEKWEIVKETEPQDFHIFRLRSRTVVSPRTGEPHTVVILSPPNWVNVVALTPTHEVVLIEQYRHGADEVMLEVPGGMIDEGEAPVDAAVRELQEETGYVGDAPELIGMVHPNPAFLTNRCYFVLVRNARLAAATHLDDGEDIEVHLRPLDEIPELIRVGEITHALTATAFYWLGLQQGSYSR